LIRCACHYIASYIRKSSEIDGVVFVTGIVAE
jgi:acetate kinase